MTQQANTPIEYVYGKFRIVAHYDKYKGQPCADLYFEDVKFKTFTSPVGGGPQYYSVEQAYLSAKQRLESNVNDLKIEAIHFIHKRKVDTEKKYKQTYHVSKGGGKTGPRGGRQSGGGYK